MAKTINHQDLTSNFGEHDHLEISQNRTFSSMAFELLSEKAPSESELKLFDLILNLSIDHGPDTPSAVETIKATKEGKTMSESLAAGILQINGNHGGAIEPLMKLIYQIKDGTSASEIINQRIEQGKKMPGFGHRIYKDKDPRTTLIYSELEKANLGSQFIQIMQDLQTELNQKLEKNLPINIDGAIATVLCAFNWDPKLGNAVFLIARTPGLIGQYLNNTP